MVSIENSVGAVVTLPPVDVASAAFLASVLNASRDCIKVLTLDGALVYMNSGGLAVMEIDGFESVRGCPWPSFWDGDHNGVALDALARARAGEGSNFVGAANTAKGTSRWWDVTVSPIFGEDGRPTHILSISRDVTTAKLLQVERELLAGELNHRLKNVLAIVGAIAQQSFKGGDPAKIDAFSARLASLAEAQSLLIQSSWQSASIIAVVSGALLPQAPQARSFVTGPDYELTAKRGLALAMAVHELATNAAKYGAFANDDGQVRVDWSIGGGQFRFSWIESGGPAVTAPTRTGFGSRIIQRNLASEFNGDVVVRYDPTGLVLELSAPA